MPEGILVENLLRHIGRTVTIFTTSGGLSGSGFTGVLAAVTPCAVKLITDIGAAPACPVGSSCCNGFGGNFSLNNGWGFGGWGGNGFGFGSGFGGPNCGCGCGGNGGNGGFGGNWLGSITEIPIDRIASFTHNAI